jgi:hypothetical protein
MAVCSREECLRTVMVVVHESSKGIYILAAQASCSLHDDGWGRVHLRTCTSGNRSDVCHFCETFG